MGLVERLPDPSERVVKEGLKRLSNESSESGQQIEKRMEQQGTKAASALRDRLCPRWARFCFQAVMMLIALLLVCWRRGKSFVAWLDDVSPLRRGQTRELLAGVQKGYIFAFVRFERDHRRQSSRWWP